MSGIIEHAGLVRTVAHGRAAVAVDTGGCNGCGHQSGCGIGRLAGNKPSTVLTLEVEAGLQPGAQVVVSLSRENLVKAGLLAYLLPALVLMAGAALGNAGFGSDGATALGAAAGLLSGLLLTRLCPAWAPKPQVRLVRQPKTMG